MEGGTTNRAIRPTTEIFAMVVELMSEMEMASGEHVERWVIVRVHLFPSDGGRGPTRSTRILAKRVVGVTNDVNWVNVWQCTFAGWHCRHKLGISPTSLSIPGHAKHQAVKC